MIQSAWSDEINILNNGWHDVLKTSGFGTQGLLVNNAVICHYWFMFFEHYSSNIGLLYFALSMLSYFSCSTCSNTDNALSSPIFSKAVIVSCAISAPVVVLLSDRISSSSSVIVKSSLMPRINTNSWAVSDIHLCFRQALLKNSQNVRLCFWVVIYYPLPYQRFFELLFVETSLRPEI